MPSRQKPDIAVAGSSKRLVSRFYQLKTGRCFTGQYLRRTKNRPTAQCWWCRYRTQAGDRLFKVYPERKAQQKTLWVEVREESERGRAGSRSGTPLSTGGAVGQYRTSPPPRMWEG